MESDSDGLEDDVKEHEGIEVDSDTEKTPPLKFSEASSSIYKSPSKLSSSSFLPSQRNINTPSSPGSLLSTPAVTGPGAPNKRKAVSPPVNSTTKGIQSTSSLDDVIQRDKRCLFISPMFKDQEREEE